MQFFLAARTFKAGMLVRDLISGGDTVNDPLFGQWLPGFPVCQPRLS